MVVLQQHHPHFGRFAALQQCGINLPKGGRFLILKLKTSFSSGEGFLWFFFKTIKNRLLPGKFIKIYQGEGGFGGFNQNRPLSGKF